MSLTAEQKNALKGKGFILNRDGVHFSCRVIIPGGKLAAQEAKKITEIREKYGAGYFTLTHRLNVEIPGIAYQDLDEVTNELKDVGLTIGGTGPRVRPILPCKGFLCSLSFYDTNELTLKLNEKFYHGLYDVKLPSKFRIHLSGCTCSCSKPQLGCIGLQGKKQNKVVITVGGMSGRHEALGKELNGLYSIDEAVGIIEKQSIIIKKTVCRMNALQRWLKE